MDTGFSQRLRHLRVKSGLSQDGLARAAGLSTSGVAKLERPGTDPSWSTVLRLSSALGVSPSAFVNEEPNGSARPKRKP